MLSSCISTWQFPNVPDTALPERSTGTLYYQIEEFHTMLGGANALRKEFPASAPFARVELRSAPPDEGIFCRVRAERIPPSVASGVFAYVSYVFLFTTPFWSTEGYSVRYHIYVDGQEEKVLSYDIERSSFFWLLVLPVSWINLLTASEEDAFRATVHQFFVDAEPFLRAAR